MSRRTVGYGGIGLTVLVLGWAGLALAEDPILDPSEPPVRLKKKAKARRDKEPAADKKPEQKPEQKPEPEAEAKKDGAGKKPTAKKPARPEEDRKKVVQRVLKNMRAAENRLARHDPGQGTRQIQRDILKDLDTLIEQTRQQPPPQQSRSSSRRSLSRKNQSQSQDPKNSKAGKQPQDPKNSKAGKQPQNPKNSKAGKQPQTAKKSGKKPTGKNQTGGGKGKTDAARQKDRNKLADLFKDVWGHLPETMRQEMDAYSRAKFIPKYDALLRQYYRSLSEQSQNRRKQGD